METNSGSTTSTKQFIWCNQTRCEQRDAVSAVSTQFFTLGEQISGTGYFFTADHLANDINHASKFGQVNVGAVVFSPLFTSSIREMTNSGGTIQSQLMYDSFGRAVRLQGAQLPDFQFGDYYYHASSGLNLTTTRAYSSLLGRFISRDIIEEDGGNNLFAYMNNHPNMGVDPEGTCALVVPLVLGGGEAAMGAAGAAAAMAAAGAMGTMAGQAVVNAMSAMNSGAGRSRPVGKKFNCKPDPCNPPASGFDNVPKCMAWCDKFCPLPLGNAMCKLKCQTITGGSEGGQH